MKRVSILVMAAFLAVLGSNLMAAAEKNPFEKDVKEIKALKKQLDDLQGKENQDKAIEKLNKKYESAQASLTKKVEKINGGLQKTLDKIDKKITAIKDKGGDVTKVEEEYKKIQDKIEQIRKWSSIEEEGGSKDSDKDDKKDDKKADKEADKDDEKSDDKEDEEKTDKKSKKSKK